MSVTLLGSALAGLGLSGSLIVAIGAQNAFVLRQGLRREHVGLVATLCFVSDATLIVIGCAGLGQLIQAHPAWVSAVTWVGAAFLTVYGLLHVRSALRPQALQADAPVTPTPRGTVIRTVLALTWLNPHVYLDTVLLLGSIAGRYPGAQRVAFAVGACTASLLWFYGLGYGAVRLAPLFARPGAWRVLDGLIAVVMLTIAASLLLAA